MASKETLSDKAMYQMGDEELDDNNMVFTEEDVKEFIKALKAEWDNWGKGPTITDFNYIIDELAGERLI